MRHQLHTYTSCFRIYRRSTISQISVENHGFVGIPELLWKVELAGGRIVECPATLTVRTAGQSKMRIARVTLAHLKLLSRIAWQRLFGKAVPRLTHLVLVLYPPLQPAMLRNHL